ncbi:MAG: glycosyltransferase family 2 protein [Caulobacteraceae bacterium]|nr:glycosyltransferase family 2 protein [Caulobacteraceae bacterium]
MTQPIDVSVVIPCLNEEDNVGPITAAVAAELAKAGVSHEIILIDNASTDATVQRARALCAADPRVRLIVNNRDYGQMRSPTHGIYQASGAAVIGMCADFQDPPALIGEFIARWRAGARIVLGVRRSEDMTPLMRLLRTVGYGFFQRFGDYSVIPGATGFGLYDREVVDRLARWREPEPFFRGMLVESGYALETIPYNRPPRAGGVTKNDFASLLGFAISGLGASSRKLLRAPLYLAAVTALATAVTGAGALVAATLGRAPWPWLWLTALEFNFAWVFFFLGVLGEQVRLISERTRHTPLVIEKERVNFPAA